MVRPHIRGKGSDTNMVIQRRFHHLRNMMVPLLLGCAILAAPAAGETRVGGKLPRGETVWTKDGNPYIAQKDVLVPKGGTLRIGPGVNLLFKSKIADREGTNPFSLELLVRGTLIVEGAEADTVLLSADGPAPTWNDWQGVVLQGTDAQAEMKAVQITNAMEGITVIDGGRLHAEGVTIKRSMQYGVKVIRCQADLHDVIITQVGNSGGTGIGVLADLGATVNLTHSFVVGVQNGLAYYRGSKGTIRNSVVSSCAVRGLVIRNSSPEITGCTITDNDYGLVISAGAMPAVRNNNIFDNGTADIQVKDYTKPVEMDFGHNWWGETALGLIEERILDGLDDPEVKCLVKVDPVLTEAAVQEDGER